jgi:hypothetical protein
LEIEQKFNTLNLWFLELIPMVKDQIENF